MRRRLDVRFRKRALRDLDRLRDAIIQAKGSQSVADRYLDRIVAACLRIGDAPEAGRVRDAIRPGLRAWTFERRLIIVYRLEADHVRIVRIVDGRRDYLHLFASTR